MTYVIKLLDESNRSRWDKFVDQCSNANFFHRAGWERVISEAYGHETYYYYAELDDEIVAILPLAEIKSILFGHSLVSLPFAVYGGVAYTNKEAAKALVEKAKETAERLAVDYLELRHRKPFCEEWPRKDLHVTFRHSIEGGNAETIMTSFRQKQRTVIRKSIKFGLSRDFNSSLSDFFHVYSTSVRNLGTPVFPKKYFIKLKEVFGDQVNLMAVNHEGRTVSSVLSFYDKGEVYPYYGGGLMDARDLKSNDYMYYELMCEAAARGCNTFDFGRSKKGHGTYNYKKNWGMKPEELHYEYYLVKAKNLPDVNPTNPKYKLMIELWSRLPLKISQFLGPFLSKYLG